MYTFIINSTYSHVKKISFIHAAKECEEEISQKSDIISKLEDKTEEISRILIRLNNLPN